MIHYIINCDMQNSTEINNSINKFGSSKSGMSLQKQWQGMWEMKMQKSDLCAGKL